MMETKPDTSSQAIGQAEGRDTRSTRWHRDDPDRDGPIRRWAASNQQTKATGQMKRPLSDGAFEERGESDAVAYGAQLGYQVIEEHLRRGQAAAQRVSARQSESDPFRPDVQELLRRVLRSAADVGAVWFDLLDVGLRTPDILRSRLRAWTAEGQAAAEPQILSGPLWVDLVESVERGIEYCRQQLSPQTRGESPMGDDDGFPLFGDSPAGSAAGHSGHGAVYTETSLGIEIIAACPTQVTLQLYPQTGERSFMTPGLQAMDPDKPPLTDVTFTPSGDNGQASVRIRVPEGQPPDTYTGAVLDRVTGRPQGTLSVRVNNHQNVCH